MASCSLLLGLRLPGVASGLWLASRAFPRVGGCAAWNGASKAVREAAMGAEFDALMKSCSAADRAVVQPLRKRTIERGLDAKACTSLLGDIVKTVAPVVAVGVGAIGVAGLLNKAKSALQKPETPPVVPLRDNAQAGPPNPNIQRAATLAKPPSGAGFDTSKLALVGVGVLAIVGVAFAMRQGA